MITGERRPVDRDENYPFDGESALCQSDPESAFSTMDELNALAQYDPESAALILRTLQEMS
jgi:hypothetical protein